MIKDIHNAIPTDNNDSVPTPPAEATAPPSSKLKETKNPTATPKVVSGSLHNALMRTFRGDIKKQLGPEGIPVASMLLPKNITPTPKKESPHAKETPPTKNTAIVHTFEGDMQDMIRNKKMSMTKMIALDEDSKSGTHDTKSSGITLKKMMHLVLILFFIVLMIVIISGSYYVYKLNTATTFVSTFEPSILFTEKELRVDTVSLDRDSLLTTLKTIRESGAFNLGIIVNLYLTGKNSVPSADTNNELLPQHLNATEFMTLLKARISSSFLNAIAPKYMVGIYTTNNGNIPFLVLRNNSYGYAFSGMLAWEKNMLVDLSPFFSNSSASNKPLTSREFADAVIQNMDVRELNDDTGTPVLLYSFINQGTIVITTDPRVLVEVATRIRSKR